MANHVQLIEHPASSAAYLINNVASMHRGEVEAFPSSTSHSRPSSPFELEDGDIEARFVNFLRSCYFESNVQDASWLVSTALAGAVVISAFHQRANFYSAMVYLAQSNFCLLVLVNFILLLYSSFIYGLTQLCYGKLRAIEIEQLTERAWFAITETCLAMTIFREEIGAWFLVMFTALVTGKVWGWIGDGRVEFLEQQPPLFYDIWILRYTINTVIQQARPNMMVMFLFEFAVLATCSWRTAARYILSLAEQNIVKTQTKKRLLERREEVRQQREDMIRQREQAAAAGEEAPNSQEPLPNPEDIDEMDIEVPGWATKGEWVLWLDLLTDMIKLGIYVAFFLMLLMFYGLPIHIMRDLFMTTRDFLKRLNALLRYRRAIQEMNKYPDASEQDLANENTCIICREEMHHWDPARNSIDRVRPKKLPCGHILHLGCLKSWLERQQVCPTCRSPVTGDQVRPQQGARAAGLRIQIGGIQQPQGQRAPVNNDNNINNNNNNINNNNNNVPRGDAGQQGAAQNQGGGQPRVFTFGPLRVGFGANGQQVRELAQQFGIPQPDGNQGQPLLVRQLPTHNPNSPHQAMMSRVSAIISNRQSRCYNKSCKPFRLHNKNFMWTISTTSAGPATPAYYSASDFATYCITDVSACVPGNPPRMSSPFMTRHGATGYSTTISAGSPDLPEGVVLPHGWSLMPLQRLDGALGLQQPPIQTGVVPPNGDSTTVNQPPAPSIQPTPTSGVPHEAPPGDSLPLIPGLTSPVVSPSPVTINWGGSAQLFSSSSGRLERMERAPQTSPPQTDVAPATEENTVALELTTPEPAVEIAAMNGESSSTAQLDQQEQNEQEETTEPQEETSQPQEESSDKGKGKAVTVEEADDEEN
ncbi:E3 ubiquitin-protein ligase synoviolin [Cladobotryum mycophilum]|uniref:RING-type E3 ubiquitin transferase n=1 Tax=Cladobotryum mycophilum TaxID=491253 RepID=A0ABR0SVS8_9HYPO